MISLHSLTSQRQQPAPRLEVISRSAAGAPQTYRVNRGRAHSPSVAAAYRRLALTILELDVPTLAARLTHQRDAS
jgi:hypothetical protein